MIAELIEESYALERAGKIGAAMRKAREALALAQGLDEAALAEALVCLAFLHFRLGHYSKARTLAEQALEKAPEGSKVLVSALLTCGLCAAEMEGPAAAEGFFHRASDLSRQGGYRHALRRALHNLAALVYFPRGQFELALAADQESFRLALELGMTEYAWFPLASMGWIYWLMGQRSKARALVEEMRHLVHPGSLAEGFAACLQANLELDEGHLTEASNLLVKARSVAEATGDPGLGVLVRLGLSRHQRLIGNASGAQHWASDALDVAERVGYAHLTGMALIERARAFWQNGDSVRAEKDLQAAHKVLEPLEAHFDLALASFLLAALYHQNRHPQAQTVWLGAASRIIAGGYTFLLVKERSLAFPLLSAYLESRDKEVARLSARLLKEIVAVPPPPLRVYGLGRFEVWQGGRRIPAKAWRRRAGELFRLLLVSPSYSLSREQIIECLWPQKSLGTARALFHQATSSLRRALEPDLPEKFPSRYLFVNGGYVVLRLPKGSWLDWQVFSEHVERGEWEKALTLYQGDLFPTDLYADWAMVPRERLKYQAVQVMIRAAQGALEAEDPARALRLCRRALTLEPWQEEAVFLGMQACLRLQDRAGALRLYRELEHSLHEELGAAPSEKVQRLYRSLL